MVSKIAPTWATPQKQGSKPSEEVLCCCWKYWKKKHWTIQIKASCRNMPWRWFAKRVSLHLNRPCNVPYSLREPDTKKSTTPPHFMLPNKRDESNLYAKGNTMSSDLTAIAILLVSSRGPRKQKKLIKRTRTPFTSTSASVYRDIVLLFITKVVFIPRVTSTFVTLSLIKNVTKLFFTYIDVAGL